jgi:large subunit ribosomal protein L17
MRKNIFGRQFKRDANERKALFKGLISSLILRSRIKTTEEKAKSIKGEVDKIITKAKSDLAKARYLLQGQLPQRVIDRVISEIAPRFSQRQGGYTRIIRIGRRFSDNAQMVLMEWTEQKEVKSQNSKVKSLDGKTSTIPLRPSGSEGQAETQKKVL